MTRSECMILLNAGEEGTIEANEEVDGVAAPNAFLDSGLSIALEDDTDVANV